MATYGSNVLTGGTASASAEYNATYVASKAVDGDASTTRWATSNGALPGWWRYDLGVGVTKTVQKVGFILNSTERTHYFTISGSSNGTAWTMLYSGNGANNTSWQYYTFDNVNAYRYYRIDVFTIYAGSVASLSEIQMYERTDVLGPGLIKLVPAAVTVSNDRGGLYPVGNSWDGNLASRWATTDGTTTATWKADLGSGVTGVLTSFEFILRSTEIPHAFVVAGSNDNSSWTDLLTTNGANSQEWQTFAVTNSTAYRYYRMSVSTVWTGVVVSLSEVQLWEPQSVPPTGGGASFQAVIVF